jgi:multidrug transporter EmrE-like cation transporter
MLGYFFIAMTVLLTVFGQLVLKWQISMAGPLPDTTSGRMAFLAHMMLNPWVLAGLGSAFGAALFWMLALKKMPLSTAYPFTASGFVLILAFSILFLGESLTAAKITGTLLIVSGIAVLAYHS